MARDEPLSLAKGALGEKLGEGATADVHAWAPGQVVKLFKPGQSVRIGRHEARMTQAVFAVGGPAPPVLGEVDIDGRFGFVTPRIEGPTLMHLARTGAVSFQEAGAVLGSLHHQVHGTPPPPEAPLLVDYLEASLRVSRRRLPQTIADSVLAFARRLPQGGGLCHADLHSSNVIMTAEGPRLIDWANTLRAPTGLDLACGHVMLAEIAPAKSDDTERPRVVNAAAQETYARLTGLPLSAVTAAMAPYLPIARVMTLMGDGPTPVQREALIASVEAALGAAPSV